MLRIIFLSDEKKTKKTVRWTAEIIPNLSGFDVMASLVKPNVYHSSYILGITQGPLNISKRALKQNMNITLRDNNKSRVITHKFHISEICFKFSQSNDVVRLVTKYAAWK